MPGRRAKSPGATGVGRCVPSVQGSAGIFHRRKAALKDRSSELLRLNQSDFALRTSDGKDLVSSASPATIASICQKQPKSSSDVTLYPTANVGYVSYPSYDGSGRRVSGPVYGVGMGVGVDKSPSAATTDSDRQTMETELLDKELKDAEVSKPVAGYLYFPIATKQKVEYQLEYRGTDAVTSLPLKTR